MPLPAVVAAAIAGGALSSAGSLANTGINAYITSEENRKARNQEEKMWDLAQTYDFNKTKLQYAIEKEFKAWDERLSNTAYQRAIADMQAAGINPASLAGAQMQAAYTPAGAQTPTGGTPSSARAGMISYNGSHINFGEEMFNSAISSMLAKDRDAARYVAKEMIDNARHLHKIEELREQRDTTYQREKASKELSQARLYDAMADKIENETFLRKYNK